LLSSLLLMTLVAIIIGVVCGSCSSGFPPVILVAGAVVTGAYALSRTRYYAVAVWLSLIALSIPTFASTLGDADVGETAVRAHLVWLVLPILLSGLLLSTRGVVIAAAIIFADCAVRAAPVPGLRFESTLSWSTRRQDVRRWSWGASS
jgi:hypothetical protein